MTGNNTGITFLNRYITYKMALEILGAKPNQNARIYRIIDDSDIEVISIGNMRLINREQFCITAGKWDDSVRWPVHIAVTGTRELVSGADAAEMLGLTTRTAYNLAESGKIIMYDLSPWGGQKVFLKDSVVSERKYRDDVVEARILKNTARGLRASRT